MLVTRRITGSPFLSMISFGVNSNFFAVISTTLGLTSARARLLFGATAAGAIPNPAASKVVATILFLIIAVFILLLVLCVSGSVFQHLIHPDGARVLGGHQLHFLEPQIVASGVAVNQSDSQILERPRLVEGHRFLGGRGRGIVETENQ